MEIIQKQQTILHYSIDPFYFNTHKEVERNYTTQANWRRMENESYLLTYGISIRAFDKSSGDQFLKFESRLSLKCFLDISVDNVELMHIKHEMYHHAKRFVQENSLSFFDRLRFPEIELSSAMAEREIEAFHAMTKDKVPFEQKSHMQKDMEDMFDKGLMSVKVEVKQG